MRNVSEEDAQQIALNYVKKEKKQEGIAVSYVEREGNVWIVQGTCPIDLEGHPWTEKFKVVVDQKGRITSTNYSLL